jgi:hypothetical protein
MLHPLSLLKKLPVFLFLYLNVNSVFAQSYNSSISAATGGTGRAAIEAGDVSFLNPASLVHLRGQYFFSSMAVDEFAVSLSDNTQDSSFPGAMAFVKKQIEIDLGKVEQMDMSFSLAEYAFDKFGLGVTGHYIEQRIKDGESYHKVNGDIGIIYTPEAHIGLAAVVYNLVGEKNEIPKELRTKTIGALGFNYIHRKTWRGRIDVDTESTVMAGIETYLNRYIITRFGYSDDVDDERQLMTMGLGFKGPRFAINYAYEGNPQNSSDYRHSVDLAVPF